MSDGGKGSVRRPLSVDQKTFEENWNAIFNTPNNLEPKLTDSGRDLFRGVVLGQDRGDCGGAQHGDQTSPENKPAE